MRLLTFATCGARAAQALQLGVRTGKKLGEEEKQLSSGTDESDSGEFELSSVKHYFTQCRFEKETRSASARLSVQSSQRIQVHHNRVCQAIFDEYEKLYEESIKPASRCESRGGALSAGTDKLDAPAAPPAPSGPAPSGPPALCGYELAYRQCLAEALASYQEDCAYTVQLPQVMLAEVAVRRPVDDKRKDVIIPAPAFPFGGAGVGGDGKCDPEKHTCEHCNPGIYQPKLEMPALPVRFILRPMRVAIPHGLREDSTVEAVQQTCIEAPYLQYFGPTVESRTSASDGSLAMSVFSLENIGAFLVDVASIATGIRLPRLPDVKAEKQEMHGAMLAAMKEVNGQVATQFKLYPQNL